MLNSIKFFKGAAFVICFSVLCASCANMPGVIVTTNDVSLAEGKLYRGIGYLKHDKIEEAIFTLKEAISLNSKNYLAHYYLALCFKKSGVINEAILEYGRAISIFQGDVRLYYNLGLAYYKTNQLAKAEENFDKAKSIDEGNKEVYKKILKRCREKAIDTAFLEKVERYFQFTGSVSEASTFAENLKTEKEQEEIRENILKKYSSIQEEKKNAEIASSTLQNHVSLQVGSWLSARNVELETRPDGKPKYSSKWNGVSSQLIMLKAEYIPAYWLSFDGYYIFGDGSGTWEEKDGIGNFADSDVDGDAKIYGANLHVRSHKIDNFTYDGFIGFQHIEDTLTRTEAVAPPEGIPGFTSYDYSFDSVKVGLRMIYSDPKPSLTNFGIRGYISILPWVTFEGEGALTGGGSYARTKTSADGNSGFDGEIAITYHPFSHLFLSLGFKHMNIRVGGGEETRTSKAGVENKNDFLDGFRATTYGPFISASAAF